nr:hypothetical protein [Clostridia bacterium]
MFYVRPEGIYGQNYLGLDEPEVPKLLVDFSASSISTASFNGIHPLNDRCSFILSGSIFFDDTNNASFPAIIYFDEVKAAKEMKTVTLAYIGSLHPDVESAITHFNMTSSEYRIKTLDYSEYNSTENPNGAIDQLLKEFGAGKYPDILCIPNNLDYNNLVRKGFMYNLYDLGFDGSGMVKSVREMSEFAGGLYKLPMTFDYTALVSHGDTKSLSLTDLMQLYKTHGNRLIPQLERDLLINYLIKAGALGKFIDYDKAECDFEDAEFVNFLNFLRSYNNEKPLMTSIGYGTIASQQNL